MPPTLRPSWRCLLTTSTSVTRTGLYRANALRGWASSLTTTAELGRMYVHHGVVVVEQKITSGEDPGIARTGAAAFRVVQDHVASVFRHEDLASALAATELTEDDLVD